MPTNLLTGEIEQIAKDKPKNLLPELTSELYKDKDGLPGLKREFSTEAVIRPAPPEEPVSQFMKRVSEFVGLRKSDEERIAESQVIYSDAKALSEEKGISLDNAITYERTRRESDIVGAIKVFGEVLTKVPAELKTSILKMHQGAEGASVTNIEGIQETLRNASIDSDKFVEDVWREYGERKILPGIPIKITDVAELPQNMGFSLTSMGAGLAFGVPIAFAPFPGARVVAWGTGTIASGKAAFEMSTYEIMQMYLEFKNEEMILAEGRGITAEEENKLKEDFNSDAREFGLWEAIPEALSNLAFAKLLTTPLTKMVGKGLAGKIITKFSGIYGGELLTETITEKGQSAIMQKAGLEPTIGPISWKEAFKRVAPQTFLLTTILGGIGTIGIKTQQKIMKSLKKEIGTEHPKYEKSVEAIDKIVKEVEEKRAIPPEVPKIEPEVPAVKPIVPEVVPEVTPERIIAEIEKVPEIIKEPQIVLDLKEITEKINTLRSEGKPVPESLTKRQQAIIKSLESEKVIDIEKAPPSVMKILGIEPAEFVRVRETTLLKRRMQTLSRGIRLGEISTKEEIKKTQTELIEIIEKSDLEAKDKAKFIKTIKNIQTAEQLTKALPTIRETIARLEIAEGKRVTSAKIKKELKTTKPLKVGQKRVGKFDYDTNKMFDTLRDYNKLNQEKAQAEFDKFPEEVANEVDLIKKRFLSLKANGASASLEIHEQVHKDILRIKELGRQAKDEADLEKKLNRQERVDSALMATGRIKADKKAIKTKIVNVYRKGFSNIYSMLNSLFGKKFAEKYDPEINENKRNTAIYFKTKVMTEEITKIYGEKNAFKVLELLAQKEYSITDIEELTTELSKLELIDIYNSLKNDKKREDYYNAFGEKQVQTLLGSLEKSDEVFGDYLQETVQEYRKILNERNIEITGRDLGFVENYWPATSEFVVSVIDDIRLQGETPSALKERAKTEVIPVPKDAWSKAQKHIAQAEHVSNLSRQHETLKRIFTDRKVKHTIKEKFGNDVYNVLMDQVDNISLNAQSKKLDAVSQWFGFAINNWVTAKIALNPSTYIRQLMSVGNYIELMNSGKWVEGFRKGILSPKVTFDFMWKNAPFLEARFNRGYSEALKAAIEGAEKLNVNWGSYTKFLTSLARHGDVTAIVYGGFPLVQSELAKGKSIKQAMETFEKATLKSQQSGLSSSISQFQNSRNPFARLFLAFKNTSNQYFRKMGDAVISRANGNITTSQFAKTMLIYAVIQPIMYASSGFLLKEFFRGLGNLIFGRPGEDPEEIAQKWFLAIITQIAVAPVNAMPIIDDIVMFAVRKLTGQKIWKVFSTPLFDDLETGLRKLGKEEPTAGDYLEASASVLEPVTAMPIKVYMRLFDYLTGRKKSIKRGVPRI